MIIVVNDFYVIRSDEGYGPYIDEFALAQLIEVSDKEATL